MSDAKNFGERELPMFPLGSVALPGVGLPLQVFEPRYRALILTCLSSDRLFGSVLIERGSEVGGDDQRSRVGSLLRIIDAQEDANGRWFITAVGVERLRVLEWLDDDPFPRAIVDCWPDAPCDADLPRLIQLAISLCLEVGSRSEYAADLQMGLESLDIDPMIASFQLVALSALGPSDQFDGLCAASTSDRLEFLCDSLRDQRSDLDALEALNRRESPDE